MSTVENAMLVKRLNRGLRGAAPSGFSRLLKLAIELVTMCAVTSVKLLASTATSTFNVTANVQSDCLVTATSLPFGTYTGTVANATSSLAVTCTNTTAYNVGLNAGTYSGATVTSRQMTGSGSASLAYALYSNSGMTTNWGQTVGTDTVTGTGNGAAQPLTVYGQVAASQYPTPGAYTDTITVTVTY